MGYQAETEDTQFVKTGQQVKIENDTYIIIVSGDANGDGTLDIIDLVRMKKQLVELEHYDEAFIKAMDINENGEFDIADIAKTKKILVGIE